MSLKNVENGQFSINEIHVNKFIAVIILTKTIWDSNNEVKINVLLVNQDPLEKFQLIRQAA